MRAAMLATVLFFPLIGGCGVTPASDASARVHSESEEQGWNGTSATLDPAQVADGRRIAETECAACHAIDKTGKSPNPTAPPLREVLAVNDPDNLAYRFIDAMRVGHDEMPLFDFDVRAADALIAYLKSVAS